MKNIPNLTGLRFLLACLVIIYHIPGFCNNRGLPSFDGLPIFSKGSEAVYMFFALSGFLIIRNLFIEKEISGTISLLSFYRKRIFRIFPIYYLVLFLGLIYYQLILPYFGYEFKSEYSILNGLFLGATFFSNIFAVNYHPGGILEMLWSIGIEEQFYLLIAPLILFIPVKRILPFLLLITVLYFSLFFNKSIEFLKKYEMYYYFFSASGFLSIIHYKYKDKYNISVLKYPILTLLLIYFSTNIISKNFSEIAYQIFSVILFSLSLCVLDNKRIKILDNKIIRYLGNISYGIYMYHAFIMQIIVWIFLKVNLFQNLNKILIILIINLSIISITILVSHLSYKYFEMYFLKKK